mmetsp:Transcript_26998/g.39476  ORF Transcript_26998/g.39476 Transcript_26998/m.39476 type:complete len:239 (-) Transcript_26998:113-829(-)|eukprot:CAMPEP_0194046874 /NCGR_PEP_ID=MMETSP0009_2-20130614/22774_1 /TAXON_ID=210454 /ORGANISM="Grammatophora oceanica, Strain CCMP 410" /LENGTH=238 /DNA_ID=CAMNT_0038692329 /DNA_START=10 /DNA_END=726 /DNA_ORIENTATION=-
MATTTAIKAVVGRALRETGAALREVGGAEIVTRHRPRMTWGLHIPFVPNDCFIAPTASVIGDVTNWDESTIWYGAVIRADQGHPVEIGFSSSIGEGSVITTLSEKVENLASGFPPIMKVGHYVTIGAGSVLTSCTIDDLVVIGDKCVIGEGAIVESHAILEAGTVVPAYARIPSGEKWGGNPATYIAEVSGDEKIAIQGKAEFQHNVAKDHLLEFLPIGNTYVHMEELEKKGVKVEQG